MLFNSLTFPIFFVALLGLYWSQAGRQSRLLILLLASYLFYSAWNPWFVLLLVLSTVIDFYCGIWLEQTSAPWLRRAILVLSIGFGLLVLGFFKYFHFGAENASWILSRFGVEWQPPVLDIVLPVGISFYTFMTMSYTIDIYRQKIRAERNLLTYATFIAFLPHLVAGPILRAAQFLPLLQEKRRLSREYLRVGLALIAIGFFKKVAIADNVAVLANMVYDHPGQYGFLDCWIGTFAFAVQIYCDFSGYSDIALGTARLLGFEIPENFNYPYIATGFSDFWRRWHISLSQFLRDYLYVPLGGNRKGSMGTMANLMITMLLGGLWHGAGWTFVVWGGLHGLYLIGERLIWKNREPRYPILRMAIVFLLVNITWVFFRSHDFSDAWQILRAMLMPTSLVVALPPVLVTLSMAFLGLVLAVSHVMRHRSTNELLARLPDWAHVTLVAGAITITILMRVSPNAFIYFQF